jgi:tetratricopeptide (TPR) repeat protein
MAGVDPKALSVQLAAAATLMDDGKWDQALAAYHEIKTKVPSLSLVNLQIGNAYLAKHAYTEAEAAFQEVLKADDVDPNGLFAMGTLKEAQGQGPAAREWYEKASAADPHWTRPLMRLAAVSRAAGDTAAAGKYLSAVIAIDPASADAAEAASLQKQLTGAASAPHQ